MAIDTTPGGASSNSYATVAEADSYFSTTFFNATWSAFDTTTKENWLVNAARTIDRYSFRGGRWKNDQALAFPRVSGSKSIYPYVYGGIGSSANLNFAAGITYIYPYGIVRGSNFQDDHNTTLGEIPIPVKYAQFEMISWLSINQDTTTGQVGTDKEIQKVAAINDLIEVEYLRSPTSTTNNRIGAGSNLQTVLQYLDPWLYGNNAVRIGSTFL